MGESITALWADRMGLKRLLIAGVLLTTECYALLPVMGTSLSAALTGLFLIFMTFEFSIVCSFSVAVEVISPQPLKSVLHRHALRLYEHHKSFLVS